MLKEFFELDIRFHVTPPLLISFSKCLFNHRDLRFIFLTSYLRLCINTNLLKKKIKFLHLFLIICLRRENVFNREYINNISLKQIVYNSFVWSVNLCF